MNRISKWLALGTFAFVVLALPSAASAQWYPGGNGGYGNYNRDLRGVADRLVSQSKNFERRVDNTVDRRNDRNDRWGNRGGWGNNRGSYGGGYYSDDLKQMAGDFRRAAEHFEKKYGNGRDLRNSEDAARRLLDTASRMDNALRGAGYNNALASQWNSMRNDLNMVASTYGYGNYNNRGNNRNNRNRNGGWINRLPFPF